MMERQRAARGDVLASALVLFAIMVAHTILETARDALFLSRLGPDQLAWVYLAMAAIALAAFLALRRWAGLRDPRRYLLAFLLAAAIGTAGFAVTVGGSARVVFAFYVWTGLVATLVVPSFWTLLDRSVRIGQAKRAFATIGAGGVIGAMAGSIIAGGLGHVLGATDLVAVGAVAYGAAALSAVTFAPRELLDEARPHPGRSGVLSSTARRYVVVLVVFGIVSTVALTLGDLLFKRSIAQHVASADLATTFGAIYAGLNAVSLAVQLVVTRKLLATWGVGGALVVLPVILAVTGFGFALTGVLVVVLALKLGDGALRHSLHRVTSELLYLPIPAAIRDGWKPAADALVLRGGEAIAAIATFTIAEAGGTTRTLAFVAATAATLWLVGTRLVRRAYVGQFRDTLRAGEIERDVAVPEFDADTVELLVESLSSPEEHHALAALELLAGRARIPALVLYHRSPAVVVRALAILERDSRSDVEHALAYLLEHDNVEIRAAALAATAGLAAYRAQRVAHLGDADPRLRAAAAVASIDDPEHGDTATAVVSHMVEGATVDRLALARAISHVPGARLTGVLYELLPWHEPDVMREAVHVISLAPERADLDRLLGLLAQPYARGDVRRIFLAAGRRGLDRLIAALEDPRTPLTVRQHVPRTISRFGSRRAAAALVRRLAHERDATTLHKILRALGRMRASDPTLRIDHHAVRAFAMRAAREAARYATLGDALREHSRAETADSGLISELLREEYEDYMEHVFRALGILHPRSGLRSVYDALLEHDEARRGAAREVLEASAPADLRRTLLALLGPRTAEERRNRLGKLAAGPFASYEELVAALLSDPSESVRCIAAYHVAERQLTALRPELVRLRATPIPVLVTHAFDQAIARLDVRP
ncbi:MAG TPA: hypothetical protein VMJ10_06515 [Kofleriaceae bacterium]|nr:hypothetical protein [Kofleriaceae bacterium]